MSEIDQQIRDYYSQQGLDDTALERIHQAGRLTRRPQWAAAGWAVAATLALLFSLSALFVFSPDDGERLTEVLALEVLKNHEKQLAPETTAASFVEIQAALPRLRFTLVPEKPELLGDWRPVGGRYCSLGDKLAAQIDLVDSRGKRSALYIAPLTPMMEKVDPCVRHFEDSEVHFWRDAHRLFALVIDH